MAGAEVRLLPDGRRLHLHHGPIDVVLLAWGERDEVARAYRQAAAAFAGLLDTLAAELPLLRRPVGGGPRPEPRGPVARRMVAAVWPHRARFITPMAAVAGAVADELLRHLCRDRRLTRAYVNDGGDIALHVTPGPGGGLTLGLVADIVEELPRLDGRIALTAEQPVRGVATSGRGGRSFSLGIADAVTVLAAGAAAADAAATMVANAVDLPGHPAIRRRPARALDPDSDLGDLPVTVGLGDLAAPEIEAALAAGAEEALRLREEGLLIAAGLWLRGRFRAVGPLPALDRR